MSVKGLLSPPKRCAWMADRQEFEPAAIVTGAAGGIGAAVAARLKEAGYQVAGIDLQECPTADRSICADVTNDEELRVGVYEARRAFGPIEVLVTAAGHYERKAIAEIDPSAWGRMLEVHLAGTVNACRAVLDEMVQRGRGIVITVSSELALAGGDGDAHYVAVKGALVGLTRGLAAELSGTGVRVHGVAPGPTDTEMLAASSPWRSPEFLDTLPMGRLVRPEEVAATVAFFVEEGHPHCGQTLSPNAGAVI